jgi:hypothetical protein
MEVNELNIFCLLLSSGLDYITSTNEFCRFLGFFCLLSSFNLSKELNWNLMQKVVGDKVMSKYRFNELTKLFENLKWAFTWEKDLLLHGVTRWINFKTSISCKIEYLSVLEAVSSLRIAGVAMFWMMN